MYQQDYKKLESNVFHKTPEGYLTGKLNVTGAGVFRYLSDGRKFVGRLRSVEEVKNATDSLNCKPVTLQHPNEPVSIDNSSDVTVGMSSNDADFDGLNNHVTITVTDKAAVEAIERGEVKAISCGYRCNVVDNAGVWQGSRHDQEQREIVYNHIALVREGRAGDQVRFCVGDSADVEEIFGITLEDGIQINEPPAIENVNDNKNKKEQSMKTIQLDGVDYQADEKVVEALQAAQKDAATKLDEIHTLLDNVNDLETQVADLQGKLDAANDEVDENLIDAAVNAKITIIEAARSAGIECDANSDVSDLKRKVIKAAFDSIDIESITDESSINSLFGSACAKITKDHEDDEKKCVNINPATQFDGAGNGAPENFTKDAMEQQLWNKLHDISVGNKKEG